MYTKYYSIILVKIIMTIGFHVCYCINNNNKKSNDIDMNDITSLSELPIEKLLLLRQSLKHEPPIEFRDFNNKKSSKIKTQNTSDNENGDGDDEDNKDLLNRRTTGWGHEEPYDYHHGHHEYHDENMLWLKSKGDIQTIFQATVTVLAFLAFGGYLICLVVTSFKNSTQNSVVVQQTTTTTTTNRSNKIRRDINRKLHNRFNRKIVNNNYRITNNTFDDIQILCQIAEGYTKYHTLTST